MKKKKQWLQYLNDADSIFQRWQSGGGGGASGIIVTRATGCPEEEVRAESYSSIQGQRGRRLLLFCLVSGGVLESLPPMRGSLPQPRGGAQVLSRAAPTDACRVGCHEGNPGAESNTGLQRNQWKHFPHQHLWIALLPTLPLSEQVGVVSACLDQCCRIQAVRVLPVARGQEALLSSSDFTTTDCGSSGASSPRRPTRQTAHGRVRRRTHS